MANEVPSGSRGRTDLYPWLHLYETEGKAVSHRSLRVDGELPAGLRGSLYRVGPGRCRSFGMPLRNIYAESDGYVGAFHFRRGQVDFVGRYVETPYFLAEARARRRLFGSYFTLPPGGAARRMLAGIREAMAYIPSASFRRWNSTLKDTGNHTVRVLGDRIVVLGAAGRPYALDRETLETRGEETFGGVLPRRLLVIIGESHQDPQGGCPAFLEIIPHNTSVRLWTVDGSGHGTVGAPMPLPQQYLIHDYGLTRSKIVIPAGPVYLNRRRTSEFITGRTPLLGCFEWHEDEPTRFFVIDRATGAQRVHEHQAGYPEHIANTFDDGEDVVIDMTMQSERHVLMNGFSASLGVNEEVPGFEISLLRFRLRPSGETIVTRLAEGSHMAPTINERYEGVRHRYLYGFHTQRGIVASDRVVKVDTESGREAVFAFGEGCIAGEPTFVERPDQAAEDDGWLLSLVYDTRTQRSFLSVLSADRFGQEEARVHLPEPLPSLLHGRFAAETASTPPRTGAP